MSDPLKALAAQHGWSEACLREVEALLAARASPQAQEHAASQPSEPGHSGGLRDWTQSLTGESGGGPVGSSNGDPDAIGTDGPVYDDRGPLGRGGMGEVRRVWDRRLRRDVAMKLLRTELVADPSLIARFSEEAQTTAQLEHPGIVPVHALGKTEDGRPYFTMKKVAGQTLTELIVEVHAWSRDGKWVPTPDGWTFHRLIQAFHRACEAVGFAHARGVIHRDLKPDNIMLGGYGEVLVLDWGLAKVLGEADRPPSELEAVQTDRSMAGARSTKIGVVAGTPAYMPPEQARGEPATQTADVYALGAILYEILAGTPPYQGTTADEVLTQVRAGPPPWLRRANRMWSPGRRSTSDGPALPDALVDLCDRAMSREPAERFADAGELASAVLSFLDGAKVRDQALDLVAEADALDPRILDLDHRARLLRAEAYDLAARIPGWASVADKHAFWEKQDQSRQLEQEAAALRVQRIQFLRGALSLDHELPEAHSRLADHYRLKMQRAEDAADSVGVRQYEWYLRVHDDGRHADFLRGDGALTLITDPPGATVELLRCVEHGRRITLEPFRSPGRTPLRAIQLPMGSYVVVLRKEGFETVRYPVHITRLSHWDGVPPGASESAPIHLPRAGQLGPDSCYVPAGWFIAGGDPEVTSGLSRRRLWLDSFVIERFPVTNADWMEFLNALVAAGREEDALRMAPRERTNPEAEPGQVIYGRRTDGTFMLRTGPDGRLWEPDWPVNLVDWRAANAYAAWRADRTGVPWRLPWEFEREKASRGVDGRVFPWGEYLDPTFTNMQESFPDGPQPCSVRLFPVDESPYGVRGTAGNVRDWCLDRFRAEGPDVVDGRFTPAGTEHASNRTLRGGAFTAFRRSAGVAFRLGDSADSRHPYVGLRLCRTFG